MKSKRQYSKNNVIRGIFKRYGLFTMTLPIGVSSFPSYLKLDRNAPNDDYKLYCCIGIVGGECKYGSSMHINFQPSQEDLDKGEMDIYLILPIAQNKEEIIERMAGWFVLQMTLYYDLEYGELRFFSILDPQNTHKPRYLEGFDYKITCLAEYEWMKQ